MVAPETAGCDHHLDVIIFNVFHAACHAQLLKDLGLDLRLGPVGLAVGSHGTPVVNEGRLVLKINRVGSLIYFFYFPFCVDKKVFRLVSRNKPLSKFFVP